MAGEGEAESPYPLHECVFRGDVAALSALIRRAGEDKPRILAAQGGNSTEKVVFALALACSKTV